MKKQFMYIAVSGLLLLSGCVGNNIADWAEDTFYQGRLYSDDNEVIKKYRQSIRMYDQFDTIAIFDAIWLADPVRTLYAQVYSNMVGKDEEAKLAFLRRQLSANNYFLSFYVLSLNEIPLTVSVPAWTLYLEIDGKNYLPKEIKQVELPVEYMYFFGTRYNVHKQPYEVFFDRKDVEGKDILLGKKTLRLVFSSPRYYGYVVWNLDEAGNVVSIGQECKRRQVKNKPEPIKQQGTARSRAYTKTEKKKRKEEQKAVVQENVQKENCLPDSLRDQSDYW